MDNRIKVLRAERGGISQAKVALALRATHGGDSWYPNLLFRLEIGYVDPTEEQASQLAAYFGVPVGKVFPPLGRRRRPRAVTASR